jgi:hypothetical protein
MSGTAETDGSILLSWLRLLGWQTAVYRDGGLFVGISEHTTPEGATIRVSGSARGEGELSLQLFEAAVRLLELPRTGARSAAA